MRSKLAYVLDTFPIVEKRDLKEFGEYRTKLLVLKSFDALEASSLGKTLGDSVGAGSRVAQPRGEEQP